MTLDFITEYLQNRAYRMQMRSFFYAKSWENFRFFEDGLEFAFFAEKG